jgi:hypothetical protein
MEAERSERFGPDAGMREKAVLTRWRPGPHDVDITIESRVTSIMNKLCLL